MGEAEAGGTGRTRDGGEDRGAKACCSDDARRCEDAPRHVQLVDGIKGGG